MNELELSVLESQNTATMKTCFQNYGAVMQP